MVAQLSVLDGQTNWHLTTDRRPCMNTIKVTQREGKGKSLCLNEFDHFLALDWSMKVMAIGHMRRRSKEPETFERPSDLKELKQYLCHLEGTQDPHDRRDNDSSVVVCGVDRSCRPNHSVRPIS